MHVCNLDTDLPVSLFYPQEGFINFFQMDDGSPENRQSGAWRIAAVAGLGLGALLMLACR